ncbi:MAG: PIN domain-containing protein [Candidatus Marsarchaeota archaeon]|nr:PIN domain-containing protein [Candidatus Marsarchaeota archaeon]
MNFVLIDTNIYLDCALIRKPGHAPDLVGELMIALEKYGAVLLLPQVVELELDRHWEDAFDELKDKVKKAKGETERGMQEIRHLAHLSRDCVSLPDRRKLAEAAQQVIESRKSSRIQMKSLLEQLFSHPKVLRLPLTSDVLTRSPKRAISGRPPFHARGSVNYLDSDSMIVETLVDFFRGLQERGRRYCPELLLLFCSANAKHFADDDKNTEDLAIHRAMRDDFVKFGVQVLYYPSLTDLVERGLKAENDTEQMSTYRRAQEALGMPDHAGPPIESKTEFFSHLMGVLDYVTQLMLGWTAERGGLVPREDYEWAFSNIDAEKRQAALSDLCTAGLLITKQDTCSVTSDGKEFLDEANLSMRLLGYRPRGSELGL